MMTGERRGQLITIPDEALHIGRGEDCGLVLTDPEIALDHAVVEQDGAGLRIRDLGSMGKILVNNREVRESALKHGDTVELGRTRLLVQAVVEAEVQRSAGREYLRERLKHAPIVRKRYALAGTAVLLFAIWFWLRGAPPVAAPPASARTSVARDDGGKSVPDRIPATRDTNSIFARLPDFANHPALEADPEAAFAHKPELTMPPDTMSEGEPHIDLAGGHAAAATPTEEKPATTPAAGVASVVAEKPAPTPPVEPSPPRVEPSPPKVEVAAVAPPSAPVSPPAEDPAVVAQSILVEKARGMVAEASRLGRQDRAQEADEMLASVERMLPEYAEAYAERARLYEERGMLDPALAQWRSVLSHSSADELRRAAQARIAQLESARRQTVAQFAGRIKLLSAEQKKFPDNERVREMRTVTVRLQPGMPGDMTDARAVVVEVSFYDREAQSGNVAPSRTGGGVSRLNVPGPWGEGEIKTVTATYTIPAVSAGSPSRAEQFYGYAVRVYHHGALQAAIAEPPTLLAQVSPPSAGSAGATRAGGGDRTIVGQVP